MKHKTLMVIAAILVAAVFLSYRPSNEDKTSSDLSDYKIATFAGGCFWCMEAAFEATDGVIESISGYTGGQVVNPTYEQVNTKTTGHLEAVQVYYDPAKITYEELLDVFWRNIDPTDDGGQFVDRGAQYTTAIFYATADERTLAEESKQALWESSRFDAPIVTEVLELDVFYRAEEYHQDYYRKNVVNYKIYSNLSGREEFKEENWGE
jgi:peptide methionine sulfoxide reductase msrA/msrB